MKSKSFNQKELSELSGIRQVSISEYLNAKTMPSAESLSALASALDVSMDWLWGRVDSLSVPPDTRDEHPTPPLPTPNSRETLLESKLRMATSALESILKELKKQ